MSPQGPQGHNGCGRLCSRGLRPGVQQASPPWWPLPCSSPGPQPATAWLEQQKHPIPYPKPQPLLLICFPPKEQKTSGVNLEALCAFSLVFLFKFAHDAGRSTAIIQNLQLMKPRPHHKYRPHSQGRQAEDTKDVTLSPQVCCLTGEEDSHILNTFIDSHMADPMQFNTVSLMSPFDKQKLPMPSLDVIWAIP